MCTYETTCLPVTGSGKGAEGWFALSDATVYVDHPVHASADHTLNIDLRNPARGPAYRVALELDPVSARRLAETILQSLDSAPVGLLPAGFPPTPASTAPDQRDPEKADRTRQT
ncbi:MAG TPA: DUF6295 family protein [Acidimicrobiales bacterium]|nr:DUF6295 family protein [Acidimicrobiales bacterium]